jgi:hypothetical protein
MLSNLLKAKKITILCLVFGIASFNALSSFVLKTSDYGEAHVAVPLFLEKMVHIGGGLETWIILLGLFTIITLFISRNEDKIIKKRITACMLVSIIVIMGFIIPFHPYRNNFIKKSGIVLASLNNHNSVNLFIKKSHTEFNDVAFPFYLPLGSRVINLHEEDKININYFSNGTFCLVENKFLDDSRKNKALISDDKWGSIINCQVEITP